MPANLSEWVVKAGGRDFAVTLGEGHATVDGERVEGHCDWQPGDATAIATGGGLKLGLIVRRDGVHWRITTHGATHRAQLLPAMDAPLDPHMIDKIHPDQSLYLLAPIPGMLTQLLVAPRDKVVAGQPQAVVEAMKMENILRAQRSGTVKAANFAAGDSLAVDAAILEFE
jgi:propionyl-CoA carboxylase alpha chain